MKNQKQRFYDLIGDKVVKMSYTKFPAIELVFMAVNGPLLILGIWVLKKVGHSTPLFLLSVLFMGIGLLLYRRFILPHLWYDALWLNRTKVYDFWKREDFSEEKNIELEKLITEIKPT